MQVLGLAKVDDKGGLLWCSEGAYALLGIDTEPLERRNIEDIVRPNGDWDWQTVLKNLENGISNGFQGSGKVEHDGTTKRLKVEASWDRREGTGEACGLLAFALEQTPEDLANGGQVSAAKLEAVYNAMSDGLVVFDTSGRVELVNDAEASICGYSSKGELMRNLSYFTDIFELSDVDTGELIPVDQWPVSRVLRGESVDGQLLAVRRLDVDRKWIMEFSGRPVYNSDGDQVLAVTITRDVTEAKQAEMELRRSQQLLKAVTENAKDTVFAKDRGGRILLANHATLQAIGKTADEIVGRTELEWLPGDPELAQVIVTNDQRIMEAGAAELVEELVEVKGELRVFQVNKVPLKDEEGVTIGLVGLGRDITEQRRIEELLKAKNEELNYIAKATPLFLLRFDAARKCTYANQSSARLFGRNPEEIAGARLSELLVDEDSDKFEPHVIDVLYGTEVRFEVQLGLPDSGSCWLRCYFLPDHNRSGRVTGWLASMVEITDLKELEQALIRSEQSLKEADRRKDEFLATLAHEIRNPLAPILTAIEIMRMAGGDEELVAKLLSTMERQTKLLVTLVDDLMDVSRFTQGKLRLNKKSFEVSQVVDSAVEASRPNIEEKHHELSIEIEDEGLVLNADPGRLTQILANLLNNAAKFTDQGGRISLVSRRDKDFAVFVVSDNGIGISQEQQGQIFRMFSQVSDAFYTGKGGLGIGLYLVRLLVELHGGRVEVSSPGEGQGSSFSVWMPIGDLEERVSLESVPVDQKLVQPLRILVADDNESARETLSLALRLLGHEVRVAQDGPRALELAKEFSPQVVILDLGMPGLDGYQVAEQIRLLPGGEVMRLVALSGWGQEEHRARTAAAGFDHHFTKPIEVDTLKEVLNNPQVG